MASNADEQIDLPIKLAAPACRALAHAGIRKLEDFTKFTETEIMHLHGMGRNAMKNINVALQAKNLSFAKK
jgi:hypothetical protein